MGGAAGGMGGGAGGYTIPSLPHSMQVPSSSVNAVEIASGPTSSWPTSCREPATSTVTSASYLQAVMVIMDEVVYSVCLSHYFIVTP